MGKEKKKDKQKQTKAILFTLKVIINQRTYLNKHTQK